MLKLLTAIAAVGILTVAGLAYSGSSCCVPGASCCFPGSPCCDSDCCPGPCCGQK
jgi:hypothetical protein